MTDEIARLSFRHNNKAAVDAFVSSLPADIFEQRFAIDKLTGRQAEWEPDHTVLVYLGGQAVALSDAVLSEVGSGASISVVALPGYGGYAPAAIAAMKKFVPGRSWLASVRAPSPGLIAILKRQVDAVHDQAAWDLSKGLYEEFGPRPEFAATQLVPTASMLRFYKLPRFEKLDAWSKQQITFVGNNPMKALLTTTNGKGVNVQDLFTMMFEVLDVPMQTRQEVARRMMLMNCLGAGIQMPPQMRAFFEFPDAMQDFMIRLKAAAPKTNPKLGKFKVKLRG